MSDFKIKSEAFDWNEPMAEEALEVFNPKEYSYQTASIIGTALAKLKMLEEQGSKVDRTDFITVKEFSEECIKDVCDEFKRCMSHETCQILEEQGNKEGRTDYDVVKEFVEKEWSFCKRKKECRKCLFKRKDYEPICNRMGNMHPEFFTREAYEEIMKEG